MDAPLDSPDEFDSLIERDFGHGLSAAESYAGTEDTVSAAAVASPTHPTPSAERASPASPPKPPPKPPQPWKDPFYLNDFSYLDNPANTFHDPLDFLKRIRPCDDLRLDVGGEYRFRFHDEDNLRLNGLDNDFQLHRTRLYIDTWYAEMARVYVEFLDAVSFGEELPPRLIDENRSDFNNLFGELKIARPFGGYLYGRYGRQELLYGAERLVSPLPWGNTRRTFEGAKLFWKGETLDVDFFWTRPVRIDVHNFDSPDQSRQFLGMYSVYRRSPNHTLDFYYLRLEEDDPVPYTPLVPPAGFNVNTFGTRWYGRGLPPKRSSCDASPNPPPKNWMYEVEAALQFGEEGPKNQFAGMFTGGLGYEFADLRYKPTVWVYYDFASGDADPTDSTLGTFNQLFPLGHKYFGFADLVGRQNIHDVNLQVTAKPSDRLTLLAWYHIFRLADARDALYNASGAVSRFDPTGAAGTDVGQELDFTALITLNRHSDLLLGYSHFFAGDFISNTGFGGDADFVYTQVTFRF